MTTMKYSVRYFLLLTVLLITSACAVLDISTLDTAVPLPEGKVQFGVHEAVGIDLTSMSFINEQVEDNNDQNAIPMPVSGISLSYGVDGENELGGRLWLSAVNAGGRLYLKHLLTHEGKNYVSLIPGITYVKDVMEYDSGYNKRYEAMGSELQLLYTHKSASYAAFTSVLRCNFNRYQETTIQENNLDEVFGPYNLFNVGIRQNMELRLGPIIFVPELGIEFVPVFNGRFTVFPTAGVGLGLEL